MIDLNHKYITKAVQDAGVAIGQSDLVKNFEGDSITCWNYMKAVRGSALCSICSGRSEIFFKDDKALISMDTCLQAVNSCEGFFMTLIDLAHALRAYKSNQTTLKTADEQLRVATLQKDLQKYRPLLLL